jgi:hypothetical protein
VQQITVSIDDTIVLHGGGDKKFIEERCTQVFFQSFPLLFFLVFESTKFVLVLSFVLE